MSAQLTDRELLEFAAKAAGIEFWTDIDGNRYTGDPERPWNPFTDDGDALRLAVTLGIRIDSKYMMEVDEIVGCMQVAAVWLPHDSGEPSFHGFGGESTESIIRGLIVRAAAEIGKAMP